MKISASRLFLASICCTFLFFSCKRSDNSIYFYSETRDTIAPVIIPSVPTPSYVYSFGQTVHMIGNVVDYETTKRGGKLRTLRIQLFQIDPSHKDSVIKILKDVSPNVDGKEGYTYSEKYDPVGPATLYCKLMISTTDYSNRVDNDSTKFTVQ